MAPTLAGHMASSAPGARLAFLPFVPRTVWQTLVDDEADLALVTGMKLPEAKFLPGMQERFCVIQRKGHPLGKGPLTLDAFCSAEHVLVSPEGGGFVGAVDEVLAELGYRRRIAISLPSFLLAPALVARTDYICMLPERLAALHEGAIERVDPPFPSPTFQMDLFWHPRRQHDPSHAWFRDRVRALVSAA